MTSLILAVTVAGFISPFITEWTKNKLGVKSMSAYFVHVGVAVVLATGALALNNEITWSNWRQSVPLVLTASTGIFEFLKRKTGLLTDLGKPEDAPPAPLSDEDPLIK